MRSLIPSVFLLASSLVALSSAFVLPDDSAVFDVGADEAAATIVAKQSERRLIELSPSQQRYATEDEKLELKKAGINFMDITDNELLGSHNLAHFQRTINYPVKTAFEDVVKPMLAKLDKKNMKENLEKFTNFKTRFYLSDYGRESSEWLLSRVNSTAGKSPTLHLAPFPHHWPQSSIIARIPGKSERTVIIGAHQDSINYFLPFYMPAPGADDDGSGTVTILEAFRVLTEHIRETGEVFEQTVEFHWYSAEEGGLLGSQAIFSQYENEGRDVVAMLQQDMTGYIAKTIESGKPEAVGVITDYVDAGLTQFIKTVITNYCDVPYVETKCGYACSDHASASKAGYPSAFVIESSFTDSNKRIHTSEDKIEYLNFDHMLQHAKLTLGFVYELGMTKQFSYLDRKRNGEL